MAKRGRKPKERKGYFYEEEEQGIVRYINSTDDVERNKIFNTVLYPALTKMIESIIRRYKYFIPDEDFDQNFGDTISYLLTKINHYKPVIIGYDEIKEPKSTKGKTFVDMDASEYKLKKRDATTDDPEYIKVIFTDSYDIKEDEIDSVDSAEDLDNSEFQDSDDEPVENEEEDNDDTECVKYYKRVTHKYKAYSYCGTICRNYLKAKSMQFSKKIKRNIPYDDVYEELNNDMRYSTYDSSYKDIAEKLVSDISNEIEKMISDPEENLLNDNEVKVGKALVTLLRDWENVLPENGSNKLQKSSILYYLREETMMTTKEVRDNMKKYKCIYNLLKKMELE